jgi:uncharacterized membrane protein
MGLTLLLAGLVLFFGPHLFTAFRSRAEGADLKRRLGPAVYMSAYSLVSLAGLVLIILGYGASPALPILYTPPTWARHINLALMLPAMILLASAYLPVGRIRKFARHPMLAAVKLWAFGHLLANGEIASVVLFGSFLAYGVIDRIALKRRGDAGPARLAPQAALMDLAAVIAGSALYVLVGYVLHPYLFGVVAIG